ncbi:DNA repair photolyase [Paenibacillus uliginis N3/975]|uniref:DNA repair photolyase n=1 Tax=Paenibacillus uliginis N3/975 TaxID=1313296 RepID=A0A1X7GPU5_9BACL|nr:radical SAM protein [Paenibacillus uliginis]SMF72796.1 DNA repair photolyase [Paenibacillus uliginis N3/975]
MTKTIYEKITAKQTLNRVKEEKMPFDWSINPYRGCAHGCSFCYARAFQSFIGMGAQDEFQHHIFIKNNAAEALEAQLAVIARKFGHDIEAVRRHIGQVTIGTATDPYQPVESKTEITRECLKLLAKYRISTSITTRSPLVLRDLDILTRMDQVSVNISINTLDDNIIHKLEPASPHPAKRMETVQRLSQHGIRTGIFAAPVLPFLTDREEQMNQLLYAAKEAGADFAMISLLRLSRDVKDWYMQTLRHQFPEVVSLYTKLYSGSAYAEDSYVASFKTLAEKLLLKYELTGMSSGRGGRASNQFGPIAENEAPWAVSTIKTGEDQLSKAREGQRSGSSLSGLEKSGDFEFPRDSNDKNTADFAPTLTEGKRRGKLPIPSSPVEQEELTPEIEQLSFPF